MPRKPPPGASWLPPKWELADAGAMQALSRGEASSDQQKRALDWIINAACATYDMWFEPGGEEGGRATDFGEGRRMVGGEIINLIKVNLSKLRTAHGGHQDEQPWHCGGEPDRRNDGRS